ncbi:LOW QUALITY PROTEIN: hypothetical protein V2J09_011267, partial [Rumex salicifolius]
VVLANSVFSSILLYGSTQSQKKVHLIAWEKISRPRKFGGLVVMLAKLGWRTIQEPESLWSHGKYCKGGNDVDMFTNHVSSSYNWKALCMVLHMVVGNGLSTLFWDHKWLCDQPLSDVATALIPDDILVATDLTPSEKFTTSSVMRLIRDPPPTIRKPIWDLIWTLSAQQCVPHFAYLVAHNSILCNAICAHCHMAVSLACPRCLEPETRLQALRDCALIKNFWLSLKGNELPTSFFTTNDLRTWLERNIKVRDLWSSTFDYMLWYTWKCRNSLAFEGFDDSLRLSLLVNSVMAAYWFAR